MKPAIAILALGLLLAGCDEQYPALPPDTKLPPIPNELRQCLNRAGVKVPHRQLTVGEVERFWKTDRLAIVTMRQCGNRLITWYDALREQWR